MKNNRWKKKITAIYWNQIQITYRVHFNAAQMQSIKRWNGFLFVICYLLISFIVNILKAGGVQTHFYLLPLLDSNQKKVNTLIDIYACLFSEFYFYYYYYYYSHCICGLLVGYSVVFILFSKFAVDTQWHNNTITQIPYLNHLKITIKKITSPQIWINLNISNGEWVHFITIQPWYCRFLKHSADFIFVPLFQWLFILIILF